MKTKFWASCAFAASTLAISTIAQADMLGIYASADYWDLGGDYSETRNSMTNSNAELDNNGVGQFALSFEHPIPLIPNARIRYTGIEAETETKNIATNPQPLYEIDLDSTDFILYYEILDNIVSADIGIAAKNLNGDVTYNSAFGGKQDISETAAMLYGAVGANLPLTGLSVKGEVLLTNYGDIQITDALAEIKYDFIDGMLIDLGAKAGYRVLDIELDNLGDVDKADFNFDGPYFGLEMHF